jgi:hypothetical protein
VIPNCLLTGIWGCGVAPWWELYESRGSRTVLREAVSGRQGCESRRVKVLPPSIACYGRQAYPMHAKVTMHVLLGCKSHGCPASF